MFPFGFVPLSCRPPRQPLMLNPPTCRKELSRVILISPPLEAVALSGSTESSPAKTNNKKIDVSSDRSESSTAQSSSLPLPSVWKGQASGFLNERLPKKSQGFCVLCSRGRETASCGETQQLTFLGIVTLIPLAPLSPPEKERASESGPKPQVSGHPPETSSVSSVLSRMMKLGKGVRYVVFCGAVCVPSFIPRTCITYRLVPGVVCYVQPREFEKKRGSP